jgi:hypothetical protein
MGCPMQAGEQELYCRDFFLAVHDVALDILESCKNSA